MALKFRPTESQNVRNKIFAHVHLFFIKILLESTQICALANQTMQSSSLLLENLRSFTAASLQTTKLWSGLRMKFHFLGTQILDKKETLYCTGKEENKKFLLYNSICIATTSL